MDPNLTANTVSHITEDIGRTYHWNKNEKAELKSYALNFYYVGNVTSNLTVSGEGNVVGNNNNVVTTNHKGLAEGELKKLGESLAMLRGELLQSDKISQNDKEQSIRAIQDIEAEAAEKNRKPNRIVDGLRRTNEILKESGEVYDNATGWGKRLSEVANILKGVIPAVAPLINF